MNRMRKSKVFIIVLLLLMMVTATVSACLFFVLPFDQTTKAATVLSYQSGLDSRKLHQVLRAATMPSRTVISTIIDKSWAGPGSVLDLFLQSFQIGEGTKHLLNHIVIVSLDFQAFRYCQFIHPHCFHVKAAGMRSYNQQIKKRRIRKPLTRLNHHTLYGTRLQVLQEVIQLGYNVVYTDADVMWLRNPFTLFAGGSSEVTIGCDSIPSNRSSTNKYSSGGFFFLKSDIVSIEFLRLWKLDRILYPGRGKEFMCEKVMEEEIVQAVGLSSKLIEARYYGRFCNPSKDMSNIYTLHANCCYDLDSKVYDLKLVLNDSRKFKALFANGNSMVSLSSSRRDLMKCLTK